MKKNYETLILILIGAFGTVIKGLIKGLGELEIRTQVETIQMTALLRSARILRKVLETCGHTNSSEKLSADAGVKNSLIIIVIVYLNTSHVGQGCRIHRLHLCRAVKHTLSPTNVLGMILNNIWWCGSCTAALGRSNDLSLLLIPGLFWSRMVVPVRVLSIGPNRTI